jgi:hypothetical protein
MCSPTTSWRSTLGWDLEMLSLEIGEQGEAGFDLSLTGFDEFELGELFAERTQGRTDPDDAPEPPAHISSHFLVISRFVPRPALDPALGPTISGCQAERPRAG